VTATAVPAVRVVRERWSAWATEHVRKVVLTGFAGSALLALGSLGAGAPPVYDPVKRTPVIAVLRDGIGERVALALVYVGLAVLGMAWLHLGRSVLRAEVGTERRPLLGIGALWGAPLLVAVPLFSRDLYSYAAQAQIAHAGLDPYSVGPAALSGPFLDEISGMWVDTPAPYGPLWLGLGRAVATLTGDRVATTVLSMRLLAVAGLLLVGRYLPRLATACGADPRIALWLGVLNPLVLVHFVAGGHNDALMLGLVVAGLTVAVEATEERWVAAGVALAAAGVLVKAPAAIAVGFLAWVWARHLTGRWALVRACVRTGAVALVTAAVVTVATGLGFGWIGQLNAPGAVVTWLSVPTGLGLLTELLRGAENFVTSADPVISAYRVAGQVATVVVVFWLWLRAGRIGPVRALAAALLAIVLLGPVVQPWYVIWGLAIAAATPLPRRLRLLAAGASVWLSMMVTPQGANLFLEWAPVLASGLAAIVVTYAVLGHEPDPADSGPAGRRPVASAP
jgi:alpha-1,6-mannosyltransferase